MDPPYTMYPMEHESVLQSYSSRSQLLRQYSTHSTSTTGSRRATARVKKQTSANNSPHHVQRRRTTANHTTRNSPFQTQEQRLRNYYNNHNSRHLMPSTRPMSWHPGSETIHTLSRHTPACELAMGNTIEGLENLAVSGTPTSSVEQSVENALAMGYGFPITTAATTFEQSPMEMGGYGQHEAATGPMYQLYSSYNVPEQPQYQYTSQAPIYDTHEPMSDPTQQWSHFQPHLAFQAVQAPQAFMPTQAPSSNPQELNVNARPRMTRRASKELVSIGLYDHDDNDFMSALNSAVGPDPNRDSLGKGLKLEETWQPPNHDEEEDEEGYSTDEAEDIDEVPQMLPASAAPELQTSFYPPTYGDLSNQSFFFNDDDQYASESHYSDYYAINQQYQDSQPKVADPATSNFLWF